MPEKGRESALLVLDACCLINLLASGRCEEILARLPYRVATSRLVATQEVLTIARDNSDAPSGRARVSPALESMDELTLLELATDETIADFVRFAAELDDGEASVCALAIAHEGAVATDDRKALRVLGRAAPDLPTLQTPDLLYAWARAARATQREVGAAIRAIRDRGRFHPRRDAPRFEWWSGYLR